ncbi:nucleotidyl transferase AbiEii/AbiGii toxin family protein [Chitinophaga sp.]|uniref:nucleotidyl transferase AbiEii/AbiGii toxin family protein n=1 Tax=Chitinophaga sp. TaxID=1869181 RepID=UPI002F920419
MFEWQKLPEEQKRNILAEASAITGYPTNVIEKDWWVTVALKAVFATPWADNLVFKGGTSLSKAWNLIERFSEDIDLAIDRSALGFSGIATLIFVHQQMWTCFGKKTTEKCNR